MHSKSRAGKCSQIPGSFPQFQLSTREPEVFPGAPSEIVINDVPAWKHQGDAVDIPPAPGRVCFQGKKKIQKNNQTEKSE